MGAGQGPIAAILLADMPTVMKRRNPPSPSGTPSAAYRALGQLAGGGGQGAQAAVDGALGRDAEHRVGDGAEERFAWSAAWDERYVQQRGLTPLLRYGASRSAIQLAPARV